MLVHVKIYLKKMFTNRNDKELNKGQCVFSFRLGKQEQLVHRIRHQSHWSVFSSSEYFTQNTLFSSSYLNERSNVLHSLSCVIKRNCVTRDELWKPSEKKGNVLDYLKSHNIFLSGQYVGTNNAAVCVALFQCDARWAMNFLWVVFCAPDLEPFYTISLKDSLVPSYLTLHVQIVTFSEVHDFIFSILRVWHHASEQTTVTLQWRGGRAVWIW